MTQRAGVWLDMDNAYITYDNSYIESAWWVFKRLWDMGLVYEDYKVTPHCPRCVTSLSSHEVALGYKEDTPDPSVYVRFPASEAQNTDLGASAGTLAKLGYDGAAWTAPRPAFIAWTTTPWTLTANVALAVGPGEEYVLAESSETGERVIVALTLIGAVLTGSWPLNGPRTEGPWTEIARFHRREPRRSPVRPSLRQSGALRPRPSRPHRALRHNRRRHRHCPYRRGLRRRGRRARQGPRLPDRPHRRQPRRPHGGLPRHGQIRQRGRRRPPPRPR